MTTNVGKQREATPAGIQDKFKLCGVEERQLEKAGLEIVPGKAFEMKSYNAERDAYVEIQAYENGKDRNKTEAGIEK